MEILAGFGEGSAESCSPMTPAAGVAVASSASADVQALSFTVPDNCDAVLRGWGLDVPDSANATLRLRLTVNEAPAGQLYPNGITQLVGGLRSDELEEVFLVVRERQRIALYVGQASGASVTVHARFKMLIRRREG
jgi:hypothetical protein